MVGAEGGNLVDDAMSFHALRCAKRHTTSQAPKGTLHNFRDCGLSAAMTHTLRDALLWHMDKHGTRPVDLERGANVSRSVINKLRDRPDSSTKAEEALKIAAYYGKTLEQFLACVEPDEISRLVSLWSRLTAEERRILEAQIRALAR